MVRRGGLFILALVANNSITGRRAIIIPLVRCNRAWLELSGAGCACGARKRLLLPAPRRLPWLIQMTTSDWCVGPAENRFEASLLNVQGEGGRTVYERQKSGPLVSLEGCRRRWCRGGWRRRQRTHRGINFLWDEQGRDEWSIYGVAWRGVNFAGNVSINVTLMGGRGLRCASFPRDKYVGEYVEYSSFIHNCRNINLVLLFSGLKLNPYRNKSTAYANTSMD